MVVNKQEDTAVNKKQLIDKILESKLGKEYDEWIASDNESTKAKKLNFIFQRRKMQKCKHIFVPYGYGADFAENNDEERFLKYNGMECCECGCCSYICPAKRQLTQSIKTMRKLLLAKRKK